jgi:signal transduction histidine kinase
MQMIVLLLLVAFVVIVVGLYLYHEYSRDMRDAAQRLTFVTQVSHELKTPLTNIRLYAELLEGRLPEDQPRSRRHIGVIVNESQRLSRLINNILTFARQRRSTIKLRPSSLQISDVIDRIAEQFQPSLEAKGFQVEITSDETMKVMADVDAVEQILGNLLSNVEKYASDGQWVSIRCFRNTDDAVHIEVQDRGPGIPSSKQAEIFQPFVRCSDKLSDGVSGTGIGLTIARDLAWMQGGDLVLISGKDGTCFRLTLPPS